MYMYTITTGLRHWDYEETYDDDQGIIRALHSMSQGLDSTQYESDGVAVGRGCEPCEDLAMVSVVCTESWRYGTLVGQTPSGGHGHACACI